MYTCGVQTSIFLMKSLFSIVNYLTKYFSKHFMQSKSKIKVLFNFVYRGLKIHDDDF